MTKEKIIEILEGAKDWNGDVPYEVAVKAINKMAENIPKWIPCQERLPETGERVLITCEIRRSYGRKSRYVCKGYHVNRYEMESDGDWGEGSEEYKEDDEKYYVLEGWYETIHNWGDYGSVFINDFVLAWMPLPEAYREEGENE